MKLIVAGSRGITDYGVVKSALDEWGMPSMVVSGGCSGPDELGERWAGTQDIPIKVFRADWKNHGRYAGPLRNREMARYADALLALWDGESKGTANMILEAHRAGLDVTVVLVKETL